MSEQSDTQVDAAIPGHNGASFDLTTPRQYTARGGWNMHCECGAPLGDTGYSYAEQDAMWEQHMAEISATVAGMIARQWGVCATCGSARKPDGDGDFVCGDYPEHLATPPTTDRPADGDLGEGEEG